MKTLRFTAFCVACALAFFGGIALAQEGELNWYQVSHEVTMTLLAEERDRTVWETELRAKTEKTGKEWLTLASLALRNGNDDLFLDAVKDFKKFQDIRGESYATTSHLVYGALDSVIGNPEKRALARKLVEIFPICVHGCRLSDYFEETELKNNPDAVLQWVTERYLAWVECEDAFRLRILHYDPGFGSWYRSRLLAFLNAGRIEEYLDELKKMALNADNNNSENNQEQQTEALDEYLRLVKWYMITPKFPPQRDLSWVASCKPKGCYAHFRVACHLFTYNEYSISRDFLLRALEMPLTQKETVWVEYDMGYQSKSLEECQDIMTEHIYTALISNAEACNEPEEVRKWQQKLKELSEKTK